MSPSISRTVTSSILALFLLASSTLAHMEMSNPWPIGSSLDHSNPNPDYDLKSPLDASGSQFPCKGYLSRPKHSTANLQSGRQYTMDLAGSAFHNGGSCQISLSYDTGKSFKVIKSFIGNCPMQPIEEKTSLSYTVPDYAPSGDAVLAWTWLNHEGNREFYMNCAFVTISGSAGDQSRLDSLPNIWVANQKSINSCSTTEKHDPVFPNPGPDVVYGNGQSSNSPPTPGNCELGGSSSVTNSQPAARPSAASSRPPSQSQVPAGSPGSSDSPESGGSPGSGKSPSEQEPCPSESVTVTITSAITTTICPSCIPTTFTTAIVPCSPNLPPSSRSSSNSPVVSMPTPPSSPSSPVPIPSSPRPVPSSSESTAPNGDLPYGDITDTAAYLPCQPGAFLCVSATTFLTCAQNGSGYTWLYPRGVADGMQCVPGLAPGQAGTAQQPGFPNRRFRSDQYVRARPYGGCSTDGVITCVRDGLGWQVCDHGGWIDMGNVPAGQKCVNGAFVAA